MISSLRRSIPNTSTLALSVAGSANLSLSRLRPKHLTALGKASGLSADLVGKAIQDLDQRRAHAEKAVVTAARKIGAEALGKDLLDLMERRWNGTFSLTGRYLSTKQSDADTVWEHYPKAVGRAGECQRADNLSI